MQLVNCSTHASPQMSRSPRGARSFTLAMMVVSIVFAAPGCKFRDSSSEEPKSKSSQSASEASPSDAQAAKTIALTLEYGDGVEKRFVAVPWKAGLTVLGAMQAAKDFVRMPIVYEVEGDGATALVTSIDSIPNEGGGKESLNWIFWINGRKSDAGCGSKVLEPGDSVVWKFTTFDE